MRRKKEKIKKRKKKKKVRNLRDTNHGPLAYDANALTDELRRSNGSSRANYNLIPNHPLLQYAPKGLNYHTCNTIDSIVTVALTVSVKSAVA